MSSMIRCFRCGAMLPGVARFCRLCGSAQPLAAAPVVPVASMPIASMPSSSSRQTPVSRSAPRRPWVNLLAFLGVIAIGLVLVLYGSATHMPSASPLPADRWYPAQGTNISPSPAAGRGYSREAEAPVSPAPVQIDPAYPDRGNRSGSNDAEVHRENGANHSGDNHAADSHGNDRVGNRGSVDRATPAHENRR